MLRVRGRGVGQRRSVPSARERFDEPKDETKRPKKDEFVCTECGATVDENALTCWNCGKEFEN